MTTISEEKENDTDTKNEGAANDKIENHKNVFDVQIISFTYCGILWACLFVGQFHIRYPTSKSSMHSSISG